MLKLALDGDGAAHEGDEVFGDRHTETCAAVFAGGRGMLLFKGQEQTLHEFFAHADTCVAHGEAQANAAAFLLDLLDLQADLTAGWGEFERIGEQIDEHLIESEGIADEHGIGDID